MPSPSSMTLAAAAAEVLTRIGQLDDGVANPLLLAEAKAHINAAIRKLPVEHGLQAARRDLAVAVGAGRRFVDLPSDCRPGCIDTAAWLVDGVESPLRPGIGSTERNALSGPPAWYDFRPSTGVVSISASGGTGYTAGAGTVTGGARDAAGHDPVVTFTVSSGVVTGATILDTGAGWTEAPAITPPGGSGATVVPVLGSVRVLELAPLPASSGTLLLEYRAALVPLTEDEDFLPLDDEAVISRAAILLATTKGLPQLDDIKADFISYMASFRSQQAPGRMMSLSAWRRDQTQPVAARRQ